MAISMIYFSRKGNSHIERARKEEYSIIKNAVIQHSQIQHEIKSETVCNLVVQHGCTQFSRKGMYTYICDGTRKTWINRDHNILDGITQVLLEKIMSDLLDCISRSTNAATNRSIITSLGFLHYKNEDVLDAFCDTLFVKLMNYKYHDYSSILRTFAILQYKSERARSFIEVVLQIFCIFYVKWEFYDCEKNHILFFTISIFY